MAKKSQIQNSIRPQKNGGQTHQVTHQSFQGPVPPPSLLEGYEAIIPGAAERILRMAEQENQHRQAMEVAATDANIAAQQQQLAITAKQTASVFSSDTLGQLLGFIVSLICIGGSIYLAVVGQPWVASVLAGLPLAGIIRALKDRGASKPPTK